MLPGANFMHVCGQCCMDKVALISRLCPKSSAYTIFDIPIQDFCQYYLCRVCGMHVERMSQREKQLIRVNTPRSMCGGAVSVTVEIQESTTIGEIKRKVLKRFKPGLVDPNLFTISVLVESGNTHSCFVLRDDEQLMRLQHLWRHGPATYSLDAGEPMFVKIHTSNVFQNHVYKTVVIAEESNSLDALRILLRCKKRLVPEDFVLVRQDLRDFNEYAIQHTERLSVYCKGPYGKILLKKLKKPTHVKWDEKHLISFIDYDSPDEGLDDDTSEQGSSTDSGSLLEFFAWMSDSVTV